MSTILNHAFKIGVAFAVCLVLRPSGHAQEVSAPTRVEAASTHPAEPRTQVFCLTQILLEPGTRFYEAVSTLGDDFPDAVVLEGGLFCILPSRAPEARVMEVFQLLRSAPPKLLQAAGVRHGVLAKLPREAPAFLPRAGETAPITVKETEFPHIIQSAHKFMVGAIVVMNVLWVLPDHVTHWEKQPGQPGQYTNNFLRAFRDGPVWDKDSAAMNFGAHPYVGMSTYLLERNSGVSPWVAFLFSTGASVVWEYGFESWVERPSIQDLMLTSTLGSLLGEGNYQLTQLLRRNGFQTWEKVVLTILNPLYVLEYGYR